MSKVEDDEQDKKLLDEALLEALLAQIGQDKWWQLSEKERQQKLMELRLRERKLRKEGKKDKKGKGKDKGKNSEAKTEI